MMLKYKINNRMINSNISKEITSGKKKRTIIRKNYKRTLKYICNSLFLNLVGGSQVFFFFFGCIGSSLLHVGFLQLWHAGATLRCGAWVSHCGGFFCCGARALGTRASVVVAHGLQSAGSVAVAHGLLCSAACGNLLDKGLNPCPLHWQADS